MKFAPKNFSKSDLIILILHGLAVALCCRSDWWGVIDTALQSLRVCPCLSHQALSATYYTRWSCLLYVFVVCMSMLVLCICCCWSLVCVYADKIFIYAEICCLSKLRVSCLSPWLFWVLVWPGLLFLGLLTSHLLSTGHSLRAVYNLVKSGLIHDEFRTIIHHHSKLLGRCRSFNCRQM
jgi:hypothetical protein